MSCKYETEIHDNNQIIDNLNFKNIEVSSTTKNQIQNTDQDTILNVNLAEPNLQKNNIYNSYKYHYPSIENQQSDIIRNKIYPKSEESKFSSEIKSKNLIKKAELINTNNNNNSVATNFPLSTNFKTNDLPVNIVQNGTNNISNNEENSGIPKIKNNKRCRGKCCKVFKIFGLILLFIPLSLCLIIGLLFMLATGHDGGDLFITLNCCGNCEDDNCGCDCNCKCCKCFKKRRK